MPAGEVSADMGVEHQIRAVPTLRRPAAARWLAPALLLALAGCSTAVPVVIEGKGIGAITGRANTSGGYTGELTTDSQRCRGTFTGPLGGDTVPLEVSCTDGRSGLGTAVIADGRLLRGEVLLDDGSRLTIRASGPGFP
ncbi:hypothetical protein [Enterovirga sp.]|jgi:hypothetical protein|uniref:hypothetical protein n=1 Tax=Enterovirga sp. TaxID=2026350 RepID=UPI0026278678|nr:hypothetical protein [Enterovirga sp.]MDB5591695.1 hypothetical protein [Enterovirga sp.]